MRRYFSSVNYHARRIFFEKFALPKVVNEKISKIVLKKYLPSNPVMIDCGAHDGADTVQLARLFKNGVIHAFEPIDELFNRLKSRENTYKNIRYYQVALADKTGSMDFYVSEGNFDGASSLLEPHTVLSDHPGIVFGKKIVVKTLTLDDWARENHVSKIDMLWLDMQGYELNMLKESKAILNTVKVIHTEVSTKETYKDVSTYSDYRKFLEENGFKVVIEAIPRGWDMGNVLFVRE